MHQGARRHYKEFITKSSLKTTTLAKTMEYKIGLEIIDRIDIINRIEEL